MSRDDLERELAQLRQENARLKRLLRLTSRELEPARGDQSAWFDRPPGPVTAASPAEAKIALYSALFQARPDVYAVRWENRRCGTSGWVPAVEGGWRGGGRNRERRDLPFTADILAAHLTGTHHIGPRYTTTTTSTPPCWPSPSPDGPPATSASDSRIHAASASEVLWVGLGAQHAHFGAPVQHVEDAPPH